eukprot:TRINITY_DN1568_c0_g1_i1.p1 TRINITY_DN1568_c0_g1~~TRINITY_DN1568_c0_g1_i1.p1  ORF type:complete len:233 (-),score=66.47 TRINITY_DN1568_c0_g1_i1:35-676(-)
MSSSSSSAPSSSSSSSSSSLSSSPYQALQQDLRRSYGLYLSTAGIQTCIEESKIRTLSGDAKISAADIFKHVINRSLKGVCESCLQENVIERTKTLIKCEGLLLLQIVSIRDLHRPLGGDTATLPAERPVTNQHQPTAPKTKKYVSAEAAGATKRMLGLVLSDGVSKFEAVEFAYVALINENIPPGTKIQLKNISFRNNIILLESSSVVQVLG